MYVPDCMSCEILTGARTTPGGVIYENEHWHVDSVVSPVVWPGFLIIKLKRHCEHLAELTSEESASLGPTIQMTCQVLMQVLEPAKVYVCSLGDGIKHIHFWVLPRPPEMQPGLHWVMFHLDLRMFLTRRLGVQRWVCSDDEVAALADRIRQQIRRNVQGHTGEEL